jgi:hypothetical protein
MGCVTESEAKIKRPPPVVVEKDLRLKKQATTEIDNRSPSLKEILRST